MEAIENDVVLTQFTNFIDGDTLTARHSWSLSLQVRGQLIEGEAVSSYCAVGGNGWTPYENKVVVGDRIWVEEEQQLTVAPDMLCILKVLAHMQVPMP